eukprot:jgi/Chlat1/520/Chrsp103S01111
MSLSACAVPAAAWGLRGLPLKPVQKEASSSSTSLTKRPSRVLCRAGSHGSGAPDVRQSLEGKAVSRRQLAALLAAAVAAVPVLGAHAAASQTPEEKLLEYNRRIQSLNNVPDGFPAFVREGYDVRVLTPEGYVTSSSGLLYRDFVEGAGDLPKEGQELVFDYTGYNESGRRVDSTYQQNRPARFRLGIGGMIPGFEEGIRTMRIGGKRRIIIPPELGPPTGPSTFFSSKQYEVFDIELRQINTCQRRQVLFYSDVTCG